MKDHSDTDRTQTEAKPLAEEVPVRAPEERLQEDEEPRKRHGDALLDGSGNRHGVDEAESRPNTCD